MVEVDKALNIQIRQLEALLKTPDNNTCADCPGKTPRWASITFGTFVCLRCSGKCPLFLRQDALEFFPLGKFVCFIDTLMKVLQLSLTLFMHVLGQHRSLGVHITKIKSVNLDKWPEGKVEAFQAMSNNLVNAYWEANLPKNF